LLLYGEGGGLVYTWGCAGCVIGFLKVKSPLVVL